MHVRIAGMLSPTAAVSAGHKFLNFLRIQHFFWESLAEPLCQPCRVPLREGVFPVCRCSEIGRHANAEEVSMLPKQQIPAALSSRRNKDTRPACGLGAQSQVAMPQGTSRPPNGNSFAEEAISSRRTAERRPSSGDRDAFQSVLVLALVCRDQSLVSYL